ncbi:MAG: hypothetical protein KC519_12990, partial [Anaerolineae bacterium]|nr:hypothetical protein [Anaerolineae bacterium]
IELIDESAGTRVFYDPEVEIGSDGWLRLVIDTVLAGNYRLVLSNTNSAIPSNLSYSFTVNLPVTH